MKKDKIHLGELVGYRAWCMFPRWWVKGLPGREVFITDILCSLFTRYYWKSGVNITSTYTHYSFETSEAGFYSWKKELHADCYGYNLHWEIPVFIGTIWMWGDVYEHKCGYRAEYASICSLDKVLNVDDKEEKKLLTRFRKKYKI